MAGRFSSGRARLSQAVYAASMAWVARILAFCLVAACWHQSPPPVANRATTAPKAQPEPELCDELLRHLVDLEFAKAGSVDDADKQKQMVIDAKADEFRKTCTSAPRERVLCAIAANDLEAVASCDR